LTLEVDLNDLELYGPVLAKGRAVFNLLSDVQHEIEMDLKRAIAMLNTAKRGLHELEVEYLLERFAPLVEIVKDSLNMDLQEIEDGHPGYPSKDQVDESFISDSLHNKLIFHDETGEMEKNSHLRSALVRAIYIQHFR
jgi:hypothetical protein